MRVLVVGTGYVGLIQGVGLANLGHNVVCIDVAEAKIAMLRQGKSPIYEPGLDELLQKNIEAKRLTFDTGLAKHVNEADVLFIAVGTPSSENGRADLKYVHMVVEDIKKHATTTPIIVIKSTVPIGTNEDITARLEKDSKLTWQVISNPEFLREGTAIEDFLHPDRVVIGGVDDAAKKTVASLYDGLEAPVLLTDLATAEMIKYASNSFLATQISFINFISQVCEEVGANVVQVSEGMKFDKRIGKHAFLRAGLGYGGSCFPKDVRALITIADDANVDHTLLDDVELVNKQQRQHFLSRIHSHMGDMHGKKIAMWGIAFKPETDDIRESPALDVMKDLIKAGASIVAYDPIVHADKTEIAGVSHANSAEEACKDADALVVITEWDEFKKISPLEIKNALKNPVVFDGRNIFSPNDMKQQDIEYISIGR